MSTPPEANEDLNSQLDRPRASSKIASAQPNLLHRTLTGRIRRSLSASSSLSSTRNRRAVDSESARDRSWQYIQAEQTSQAHLSLQEYIAPQPLVVLPPLTAASTKSNLPSREPISHVGEPSVLVGEATHLGQIGGNREQFSLMEFTEPTQYQPHEQSLGHLPPAYPTLNTGYINQYSRAESYQTMAQTSSDGYPASYATSPSIAGSTSRASEYDAKPNYQYPSAIQSPSYHGGTSSPQQSYSYTTAQGHPYAPAYSAPSGYAHTQYAQTYASHYSSSYQQPHTPGAIAPQQQYGQPYPPQSPGYVDATGVRVVDETQREARCYEHGCDGRRFSTPSNLSRHQREKSGLATKVRCDNCGTEFTRSTARKGHMVNNKCKRGVSGSSPP